MRVLVLGNGGREDALTSRLAQDPRVDAICCAPGNPGTARLARNLPANLGDADSLVDLAAQERIDFTIVGPEAPLSIGVADRFARAGRLLFGPSQAAARLESSKAFAKAFMARHGVPTARFRTCESPSDALASVRSGEFGFPVVLKADGLAAGKGVVIAADLGTAESAIGSAMLERRFGPAGDRLVIEECLTGEEASFFVLSDGDRATPFASAQDHKRIFDNDRGPNTGGMGAFAPSVLIDRPAEERIMKEIADPVIAGMAEEGHPFRGILYIGLMMTAEGPKVIEFNVRFGDPEAQVILPLVDASLVDLLVSAAEGRLIESSPIRSDKLVGVVLASRGYPETSESGRAIRGIDQAAQLSDVLVFHSGTTVRDGQLVTAGGRVLTVVGRGSDFESAIARAYAGVSRIEFDGMQYRRDIGMKALRLASM
jgi:phosphoribosylamine--glycine ligase